MKRDVDLVRALLLEIERRDYPSWKDLTEGMTEAQAGNVLEHLSLLAEAGLARGLRVPLHGFVLWQDLELTFEGHEFLENVRDEATWRQAKSSSKSHSLEALSLAAQEANVSLSNNGKVKPELTMPLSNKIFIVHGHDGEARETVARFLGNIGFEPIILHEQANRGRTVIEKVEANSDVGFAVVLLTPDDQGCPKGGTLEPRARQNVLLELGYFIGKLGRENVCALKRGTVEIPSDFAGVVWEAMDSGNGWKMALGRELQAAGHAVDWNKAMR